ncbi:MAG: hypothetical protein E6905_02400 [Actinomyces sp.]|nr:hypothetical protein [Actinomyces sp.]
MIPVGPHEGRYVMYEPVTHHAYLTVDNNGRVAAAQGGGLIGAFLLAPLTMWLVTKLPADLSGGAYIALFCAATLLGGAVAAWLYHAGIRQKMNLHRWNAGGNDLLAARSRNRVREVFAFIIMVIFVLLIPVMAWAYFAVPTAAALTLYIPALVLSPISVYAVISTLRLQACARRWRAQAARADNSSNSAG